MYALLLPIATRGFALQVNVCVVLFPAAAMAETSTNGTAADPLSLFLGIGLDEKTAKNAVANAKVTKNLIETIQEVGRFVR